MSTQKPEHEYLQQLYPQLAKVKSNQDVPQELNG